MILVSACLLGHNTKYNGGSNDHPLLMKYNELGKFVAVCPESVSYTHLDVYKRQGL